MKSQRSNQPNQNKKASFFDMNDMEKGERRVLPIFIRDFRDIPTKCYV